VCKGEKNNDYYIARRNLFEGSNNLKIKFYKNRWQVPSNAKPNRDFAEPDHGKTKTYGGQFHMDYPGLEDRVIFGMSGYAENAILIDPKTSTIVAVKSIHHNNKKGHTYKYDFKKLLIEPFK